MRHKNSLAAAIALLVACASPSPSTSSSAQPAEQPAEATGAAGAPLSPEQLDQLVARVALYPDELLALVLAASTQPTQIVEAGRFLEARKRNPQAAPMKSWEPAVQSLLNYPEVIQLMNQDPAWTQALGDAVASRQADVMQSIQQVRTRALAAGNLKTNEQYVVTQENGIIQIRSADPDLIYVPNYDPIVIYVESEQPVVKYYPPYPCYWCPGAAYGMGMMMGFGWYYNDIYWDDDDIDIDIDRPYRPDRPDRPIDRPTPHRADNVWKPNRPGAPGGGAVASPRPVGGGTHQPVGVGPSTLPARPIGPSTRPAQPGVGGDRPAPAAGGGPVSMESLTKLPSGYDARPGYQKPSASDSLGSYQRGGDAMRASNRGAQSRGVSPYQSPTADRTRRGSAWGDYGHGGRADAWSSRGAASRGGMSGGGYGGGGRGGGGRGGGGRR